MRNGTETVAETPGFVLIYKPAGIPVESRDVARPDLYHSLLKQYKELHMINRLDQPVEGLVLFAKNRKSAAALSAALEGGLIRKEYLAVVSGVPRKRSGILEDFLAKDARTNTSRVVREGTKGAKYACLEYETAAVREDPGKEAGESRSLLKILLKTGRHHQIRVQLANMGNPIAGDRKYGLPERAEETRFPALCAFRLTFPDPGSGKECVYEVTPKGVLFETFYKNGTLFL